MVEYWKGDVDQLEHWFLLADDPDFAAVLKRVKPDLNETASIYVRLKDQREIILREGGEAFQLQRTGQLNELGEEVLLLRPTLSPLTITDEAIAVRRSVNERGKAFLRDFAEGKVKVYLGPTEPFPDVVHAYLQKPEDEQRQWIDVEATAQEWNEFIEALLSMPEDDRNFVWSLYVMRPHKDVVDRRHRHGPARGKA